MPASPRSARPVPRRPGAVPGARTRPGPRPWLLLLVWLVIAVSLPVGGYVPWWLVATYATMSLVTYAVYAQDKRAAVRGDRRVPERTLHRLALLCGWPGAGIAQQVLRHKTIKRSFRRTYRVTVGVNLAVVALALSPLGRSMLQAVAEGVGLRP